MLFIQYSEHSKSDTNCITLRLSNNGTMSLKNSFLCYYILFKSTLLHRSCGFCLDNEKNLTSKLN